MSSTLLRATPVLVVEHIRPSLLFFEKLGLMKTVEVPHGDELGFVILELGSIQIMLQSSASVREDIGVQTQLGNHAALFIEVDDLELAFQGLAEYPVFLPRRKTFYGAQEIGLIEPGGHHITLAQFER